MSDIEFTMSNPHASDRALMKKSSSSAIGKEKKAEETGGKLKFTDEERAEMENAFNLMCAGSTNISAKEVGMTMRKLGQNPTEKELEEMIAEVDLDDYGAVNRKNFMKLMLRKIKGGAGGNNEIDINREAFEVFDKSHQGKLVAADIRQIMTNVGEKLCDEEVEEMLKAVGADPTGITYEAFEQLVAT